MDLVFLDLRLLRGESELDWVGFFLDLGETMVVLNLSIGAQSPRGSGTLNLGFIFFSLTSGALRRSARDILLLILTHKPLKGFVGGAITPFGLGLFFRLHLGKYVVVDLSETVMMIRSSDSSRACTGDDLALW